MKTCFVFVFVAVFSAVILTPTSSSLAKKTATKATSFEQSTPDQLTASKYLNLLVNRLSKQGKKKNQIYSLISKQTKKLFSGNVVFDLLRQDTPWILTSDEKLHVFSLVSNRDKVLAYVYQALILMNDPVYQAKRKDWLKTYKKFSRLRTSLTFESDLKKTKSLRNKLDLLNKELLKRQDEIFS